jgi:transposase
VGAPDRRPLERFTRAVSQSCNLLAASAGLDPFGNLAGCLEAVAGTSGPAERNQLGGSDRRWDIFAGKKRGAEVGKTKKGKGTKSLLMVDGEGTPLSAYITSANHAEVNTLETLVDTRVTERQPERLLYDKAADADWVRDSLAARGIELICPHRRGRKKPPVQDGRPLRRYRRRYKVERTISWLFNLRRLVVRYEYHDDLFEGFLHLGCVFTILKRF